MMKRRDSDIGLLSQQLEDDRTARPDASYRIEDAIQLCSLALARSGDESWRDSYPSEWHGRNFWCESPDVDSTAKIELVLLGSTKDARVFVVVRGLVLNKTGPSAKRSWDHHDEKLIVNEELLAWSETVKTKLFHEIDALADVDVVVGRVVAGGSGWSGALASLLALAIKEHRRTVSTFVHSFGARRLDWASDAFLEHYSRHVQATWRHVMGCDWVKTGAKGLKPAGALVLITDQGMWFSPNASKAKSLAKHDSKVDLSACLERLKMARASFFVSRFAVKEVDLSHVTLAWKQADANETLPEIHYELLQTAQSTNTMESRTSGTLPIANDHEITVEKVMPGEVYTYRLVVGHDAASVASQIRKIRDEQQRLQLQQQQQEQAHKHHMPHMPSLGKSGTPKDFGGDDLAETQVTVTTNISQLEVPVVTDTNAVIKFFPVDGATAYRLEKLDRDAEGAKATVVATNLTTGSVSSDVGVAYIRSLKQEGGNVGSPSNNAIYHEVDGLDAGTRYKLSLFPATVQGYSESLVTSLSIQTLSVLGAPLVPLSATSSSVTVKWMPAKGASSYLVCCRPARLNEGEEWETSFKERKRNEATVEDLQQNEKYLVRVFAQSGAGVEPVGRDAVLWTLTPVEELTVQQCEEREIKLSWKRHHVTPEFVVMQKPAGAGEDAFVKCKGEAVNDEHHSSVVEFEVTDLEPGLEYVFCVYAGADGVYESVGTRCEGTTVMTPPAEVTVAEIGSDYVVLQCNHVPLATCFEVTFDDDNGNLARQTIAEGGGRVNGLVAGRTYAMVVRSIRGAVASQASVSVDVTPMPDIEGFTTSSLFKDRAVLTARPVPRASCYRLSVRRPRPADEIADGSHQIATEGPKGASFEIIGEYTEAHFIEEMAVDGLEEDRPHTFKLAAASPEGLYQHNAAVLTVVPVGGVSNAHVVGTSKTTVRLAWATQHETRVTYWKLPAVDDTARITVDLGNVERHDFAGLEAATRYAFELHSGEEGLYETTGIALEATTLSAVSNVAVDDIRADSVTLQFPSVKGATLYKVVYREDRVGSEVQEIVAESVFGGSSRDEALANEGRAPPPLPKRGLTRGSRLERVTVPGLDSGKRYMMTVYSGATGCYCHEGSTVTVMPLGHTSTGLKVTELQLDSATVTWEAPEAPPQGSEEEGSETTAYYMYRIEVRHTDTGNIVTETIVEETTFTVTELEACEEYELEVVVGTNDGQFSSESDKVRLIPLAEVPHPRAVWLTHDAVQLAWDSVPKATKYKLRMRDATRVAIEWHELQTTAACESRLIEDLQTGTEYEFEIIAGTEIFQDNSRLFRVTPLRPPQDMQVLASLDGAIELEWKTHAYDTLIEFKESDAPEESYTAFETVAPSANSSTTVLVAPLQNGVFYTMRVRASSRHVAETVGVICPATALGASVGFRVIKIDNDGVDLRWEWVNSASHYRVTVGGQGVDAQTLETTNQVMRVNLPPNVICSVTCVPGTSGIWSKEETTLRVACLHRAPDAYITVAELGESEATLSWPAVADAHTYRVELARAIQGSAFAGGEYDVEGEASREEGAGGGVEAVQAAALEEWTRVQERKETLATVSGLVPNVDYAIRISVAAFEGAVFQPIYGTVIRPKETMTIFEVDRVGKNWVDLRWESKGRVQLQANTLPSLVPAMTVAKDVDGDEFRVDKLECAKAYAIKGTVGDLGYAYETVGTEVAFKTLSAPKSIRVAALGERMIQIQWDRVPLATKYRIEWRLINDEDFDEDDTYMGEGGVVRHGRGQIDDDEYDFDDDEGGAVGSTVVDASEWICKVEDGLQVGYYTIDTLVTRSTYTFSVCPGDASYWSDEQIEISATPLRAPQNVRVDSCSMSVFKAAWDCKDDVRICMRPHKGKGGSRSSLPNGSLREWPLVVDHIEETSCAIVVPPTWRESNGRGFPVEVAFFAGHKGRYETVGNWIRTTLVARVNTVSVRHVSKSSAALSWTAVPDAPVYKVVRMRIEEGSPNPKEEVLAVVEDDTEAVVKLSTEDAPAAPRVTFALGGGSGSASGGRRDDDNDDSDQWTDEDDVSIDDAFDALNDVSHFVDKKFDAAGHLNELVVYAGNGLGSFSHEGASVKATPLPAPTNLTARRLTHRQAALSWEPVPGAHSYLIERRRAHRSSLFCDVDDSVREFTRDAASAILKSGMRRVLEAREEAERKAAVSDLEASRLAKIDEGSRPKPPPPSLSRTVTVAAVKRRKKRGNVAIGHLHLPHISAPHTAHLPKMSLKDLKMHGHVHLPHISAPHTALLPKMSLKGLKRHKTPSSMAPATDIAAAEGETVGSHDHSVLNDSENASDDASVAENEEGGTVHSDDIEGSNIPTDIIVPRPADDVPRPADDQGTIPTPDDEVEDLLRSSFFDATKEDEDFKICAVVEEASFDAVDLECDQDYVFRVTAGMNDFLSSEFGELHVTPMLPIPRIDVECVTDSTVNLVWPFEPVDSVEVEMRPWDRKESSFESVVPASRTLASVSVDGLRCAQTYLFRLYKIRHGLRECVGRTQLATPVEKVSNGRVFAFTDSTVTLKWDSAFGASTYKITSTYTNDKGVQLFEVPIAQDIQETRHEIKMLRAGQRYRFHVYAGSTEGGYHAEPAVIDATPLASVALPAVLAPKTSVAAYAERSENRSDRVQLLHFDARDEAKFGIVEMSTERIHLRWAPVEGATRYQVTSRLVSDDVASAMWAVSQEVTVPSYQALNVEAGGDYVFEITAGLPDALQSNKAVTVPIRVNPPPAGFKVASSTLNSITLCWIAEDEVILEMATDTRMSGKQPKSYTTVADALESDTYYTYYTVEPLQPNSFYSFRVFAGRYAMRETVGSSLTASLLPAVEGFRCVGISPDGATLGWKPVRHATRYAIMFRPLVEDVVRGGERGTDSGAGGGKFVLAGETAECEYFLEGMIIGKPYEVTIYAGTEHNFTEHGPVIEVTTLEKPGHFRVTELNHWTAVLQWNKVAYAERYRIERRRAGTDDLFEEVVVLDEDSTSYSMKWLAAWEDYDVRVSSGSSTGYFQTNGTQLAMTPMRPLEHFVVSATGNDFIEVTWVSNYDVALFLYQVEAIVDQKEAIGSEEEDSDQDPDEKLVWRVVLQNGKSSHRFSGLERYSRFRIEAYQSNFGVKETIGVALPWFTLGAPAALRVAKLLETGVVLEWNQVRTCTQYRVTTEVKGEAGTLESLEDIDENGHKGFEVRDLKPGRRYLFTVYAGDLGGYATEGSSVEATPLETMDGFSVEKLTDRECTITWNKVEGATRYAASFRSATDNTSQQLLSDALTEERYTMSGLRDGKTYEFFFSAGTRWAFQDNSVCVRCTPLAPVRGLRVVYVSSTSVLVQWLTPPKCDVMVSVRKATIEDSGTEVVAEGLTSTLRMSQFEVTGLKPMQDYEVIVHVGKDGVYETVGSRVAAMTLEPMQQFEVTRIHDRSVHLGWIPVPKATRYRLTMRPKIAGKQPELLADVEGGQHDFTIEEMVPGQEYEVAIFPGTPISFSREGMTVNAVSLTTLEVALLERQALQNVKLARTKGANLAQTLTDLILHDVNVLQGVQIRELHDEMAHLEWFPVRGATHYTVRCRREKRDDENFEESFRDVASFVEKTDVWLTELKLGETYCVEIAAGTEKLMQSNKTVLHIKPLESVPEFWVRTVTRTSIELCWVPQHKRGYDASVQIRRHGEKNFNEVWEGTEDEGTVVLNGLDSGVQYDVKILCGWEGMFETAGRTLIAQPLEVMETLHAVEVTSSRFRFEWKHPEEVNKPLYKVVAAKKGSDDFIEQEGITDPYYEMVVEAGATYLVSVFAGTSFGIPSREQERRRLKKRIRRHHDQATTGDGEEAESDDENYQDLVELAVESQPHYYSCEGSTLEVTALLPPTLHLKSVNKTAVRVRVGDAPDAVLNFRTSSGDWIELTTLHLHHKNKVVEIPDLLEGMEVEVRAHAMQGGVMETVGEGIKCKTCGNVEVAKVVGMSETSIDVAWEPIKGAEDYQISLARLDEVEAASKRFDDGEVGEDDRHKSERGVDDGDGASAYAVLQKRWPDSNFSHDGLECGVGYVLHVQTYHESLLFDPDYVGVKLRFVCLEPLSTLDIVELTVSSITLLWDEVAGATMYAIEMRDEFAGENEDAWQEIGRVQGDRFTRDGLAEGVRYKFRVRAGGYDVLSPGGAVVEATPIPPPTSLDVAQLTPTSVRVEWESDYPVTVEIKRSDQDDEAKQMVKADVLGMSHYEWTDLPTGVTHEVSVYSERNGVCETVGQMVEFTPLEELKSLRIAELTDHEVTLAWDHVPQALSYEIVMVEIDHEESEQTGSDDDEEDGGYEIILADGIEATTYCIPDLRVGNSYEFWVRATREYTCESSVSIVVAPMPPAEASVVELTSRGARINWKRIKNADCYRLTVREEHYSPDSHPSRQETLDKSTLEFSIDGLEKGVRYDIEIQAGAAGIFQSNGAHVIVEPVAPARNVHVSGLTENHLTLEWISDHDTPCRVLCRELREDEIPLDVEVLAADISRKGIDAFEYIHDEVHGTSDSPLDIDGLRPSRHFMFHVLRSNDDGIFETEGVIVRSITLGKPTPAVSGIQAFSVTLTWYPIKLATRYKVETMDGKEIGIVRSNSMQVNIGSEKTTVKVFAGTDDTFSVEGTEIEVFPLDTPRVQVSRLESHTMQVTWPEVKYATRYVVSFRALTEDNGQRINTADPAVNSMDADATEESYENSGEDGLEDGAMVMPAPMPYEPPPLVDISSKIVQANGECEITLDGLKPNTLYEVVVAAGVANMMQDNNASITATPLATVGEVQVGVTFKSAHLRWNPYEAPFEVSYMIYKQSGGKGPFEPIGEPIMEPAFNFEDLKLGELYSYRVYVGCEGWCEGYEGSQGWFETAGVTVDAIPIRSVRGAKVIQVGHGFSTVEWEAQKQPLIYKPVLGLYSDENAVPEERFREVFDSVADDSGRVHTENVHDLVYKLELHIDDHLIRMLHEDENLTFEHLMGVYSIHNFRRDANGSRKVREWLETGDIKWEKNKSVFDFETSFEPVKETRFKFEPLAHGAQYVVGVAGSQLHPVKGTPCGWQLDPSTVRAISLPRPHLRVKYMDENRTTIAWGPLVGATRYQISHLTEDGRTEILDSHTTGAEFHFAKQGNRLYMEAEEGHHGHEFIEAKEEDRIAPTEAHGGEVFQVRGAIQNSAEETIWGQDKGTIEVNYLPIVEDLRVVEFTPSQVKLQWKIPHGVQRAKIYRGSIENLDDEDHYFEEIATGVKENSYVDSSTFGDRVIYKVCSGNDKGIYESIGNVCRDILMTGHELTDLIQREIYRLPHEYHHMHLQNYVRPDDSTAKRRGVGARPKTSDPSDAKIKLEAKYIIADKKVTLANQSMQLFVKVGVTVTPFLEWMGKNQRQIHAYVIKNPRQNLVHSRRRSTTAGMGKARSSRQAVGSAENEEMHIDEDFSLGAAIDAGFSLGDVPEGEEQNQEESASDSDAEAFVQELERRKLAGAGRSRSTTLTAEHDKSKARLATMGHERTRGSVGVGDGASAAAAAAAAAAATSGASGGKATSTAMSTTSRAGGRSGAGGRTKAKPAAPPRRTSAASSRTSASRGRATGRGSKTTAARSRAGGTTPSTAPRSSSSRQSTTRSSSRGRGARR